MDLVLSHQDLYRSLYQVCIYINAISVNVEVNIDHRLHAKTCLVVEQHTVISNLHCLEIMRREIKRTRLNCEFKGGQANFANSDV